MKLLKRIWNMNEDEVLLPIMFLSFIIFGLAGYAGHVRATETISTADASKLEQVNYTRICINGTQYYKIAYIDNTYKRSWSYFGLAPVILDGKFVTCPKSDYVCKKVTIKVKGLFSDYNETKNECHWVVRK